MKANPVARSLVVALSLSLLAGCGDGTGSSPTTTTAPVATPLSAANLNLVFVVSPDLAYSAPGDVSPSTANLTNQGLQRSLLMATYLREQVLGASNVTAIYALAPMTHLQTANRYPDMAALETIQQFALLDQMTLSTGPGTPSYTGNSYPINASYVPGSIPAGVATPSLSLPCPGCAGLDFADTAGNNGALLTRLVTAKTPGFHVFSAPWETTAALLAEVNRVEGLGLTVPTTYAGPNRVYAISIPASGSARLVTYNGDLNPPSTYPALPSPMAGVSCPGPTTTPSLFRITATGGVDGVVIPPGINRNQTLYLLRHADAHPTAYYADGNYVGAGQWRALALPDALRGKISPDQVYSTDPSQVTPGTVSPSGDHSWSNVAPSLTVQPYAIANNLPYHLVTNSLINDKNSPQLTSDFFFTGGTFSDHAVLLGWQYVQAPQIIRALLASYSYGGTPVPDWSPTDYDSVWTVKIDAEGNLSVDNTTCEGIDSTRLPVTAPQF